jgi:hypothetical protein
MLERRQWASPRTISSHIRPLKRERRWPSPSTIVNDAHERFEATPKAKWCQMHGLTEDSVENDSGDRDEARQLLLGVPLSISTKSSDISGH